MKDELEIETLKTRLAHRKTIPFRGKGTSMHPLYPSGHWYFLKTACPENIKPGQIVLMYDEIKDRLVLHRLISITDGKIYTQGDNCHHADQPWNMSHYLATVVPSSHSHHKYSDLVNTMRQILESSFLISPYLGRTLCAVVRQPPYRQLLRFLSAQAST